MDGGTQARRVRSFLIGSAVGASAVIAAARRRRRKRDRRPVGLAAFEGAPCYQETMEERQQAPS
jgi:hypothetical protein